MTTRPVDNLAFETRQVHAGEPHDAGHGARVPPIYLTAGYLFDSFDHAQHRFSGEDPGYVYSRISNPTNDVAEQRLASLESGASAVVVGSGQAAVAVAALTLTGAGDHILVSPSIYEGTRALLRTELGQLGVDVEFVANAHDAAEWDRKIRPTTKFLFGETIPNPKNDIFDIQLVADIGQRHGVPLVIDNTLATPFLTRPIEHGATIVVHSTSKFLTGHGASIGGAIIDSGTFDWAANAARFPKFGQGTRGEGTVSFRDRFGPLAFTAYARARPATSFGPSLSPFNAFLLLQGVETLSLRMARHSSNALAIASWLAALPEVESVDYAGLPDNPYHVLATKYLPDGAGAVFSFTLTGGFEAARTLIDTVSLFSRMTHIGDVRSLILHPQTTTHAKLTEQERIAGGITAGLVRLSIGIERVEDLIADLQCGLDAVRRRALENR